MFSRLKNLPEYFQTFSCLFFKFPFFRFYYYIGSFNKKFIISFLIRLISNNRQYESFPIKFIANGLEQIQTLVVRHYPDDNECLFPEGFQEINQGVYSIQRFKVKCKG